MDAGGVRKLGERGAVVAREVAHDPQSHGVRDRVEHAHG